MLDQGAVDGVGLGGDLQPGGGALAAWADGHVIVERVLEQPRPGLAARELVWLDAQRQRGLKLERVGVGVGRLRHHVAAATGPRRPWGPSTT